MRILPPVAFIHSALPMVALVASLFGCSSSERGANVGAGNESGVFAFEGVGKLTPNANGTWTAWWRTVVGVPDLKYLVYTRTADGAFDWNAPTITIENTYTTNDLRLIGNTCVVVRFSQAENDTDKNTKEMCTNHEAYSFEGISEIVSLKDESYMLKWAEPPFSGAQFHVLSRQKTEVDWKPLGLTTDPFYKTEKLDLDTQTCFRVRYKIEGFPEDENQKELCTPALGENGFAGVNELTSPGKGQIVVNWKPVNSETVSGYNIYIGTDFKQKIGTVTGKEKSEFLISDLLHAVVYTIGVRAVDIYGREDKNANVISYELKNHTPFVVFVKINTLESNDVGKPTKVECVTEYGDEDTWQKLQPVFAIRNEKRFNLGLVERQITEGSVDQKKVTYTVLPEDVRADQIICEVRVNDGFGNSVLTKSDPFIIPDTPVIGTGMSLVTLQNTEVDVVLTRGTGQGYWDADQDDAVEVLHSETDGVFMSSPAFTCIDGTCTGRFKPNLGFYTNSDAPDPIFATITYQIRAGDNVSSPKIVNVRVLPLPRAINFNMIAQQDEERVGEVGVLDEFVGLEQTVFTGYTHILNHSATRILLRQPLNESMYNGRIRLPDGISADPANDIYCNDTDKPTSWVSKTGFECSIPCSAGKCPFVFIPDTTYYGPAHIDFAVEVDGLISNYATSIIEVLPNLRASGFVGLTVEGQIFSAEMKELKGFIGAEEGISVTGITVTNYSGFSLNPPFTCSKGTGEWVCSAGFQPDAGTKDAVTFNYRISAINDATLEPIESNLGDGTIIFYPKPVATGVSLTALENTPRTAQIGLGTGYQHLRNDQAKTINIINVATGLGFVDHPALGAGVSTGSYSCASGNCGFTFERNPDEWDNAGALYRKFDYQVTTAINPALFADPNVYIDSYLETVSNRNLTSNTAQTLINFRPRPDATDQQYYVREYSPTYPTSLTIELNPGAEYTHAITPYKAVAADLSIDPASGNFGVPKFTCDAVFGVCTGIYTPVQGAIGQLLPPAEYFVSIQDPLYNLNSGKVDSFPKKIDIEIRPAPKGTPLNLLTIENADFAASFHDIEIENGPGVGYTHAGGLLAVDAAITPVSPATPGTFGTMSCVGGACTQRFTPFQNTFGLMQMTFSVTVNDPFLNPVAQLSEPAQLNVDVRPLPRAYDVGTLASPLRVDENTLKVFNLDAGSNPGELQYYHPYAIAASEIEIVAATNAASASWTCPGNTTPAGRCTINFQPALNYEGAAYIDYKVKVLDPKLNTLLVSNVARIYIDVYPAPRATDRHSYVLATVPTDIYLDLRPNAEIFPDLDESATPSLLNRKGYAHRRNHLSDKVTNVTVPAPVRGVFETGWTCQTATDPNPGRCTTRYKSGYYDSNFITDDFQYTVEVGGLPSNSGTYKIEVIPTAISSDFNVVTKEGEDETVDFILGGPYTHPTNEWARRIEIMSVSKGTVVDGLAPIDSGTSLPCDYSVTYKCTVIFKPEAAYSTPDSDLTEAFFEYRVWTFNVQLNAEVPSNVSKVTVNVRPKPKAPTLVHLQIEGLGKIITIEPGPDADDYLYKTGNGRVDKVIIESGSAQNGSVSPAVELICASGICGPLTFTPSPLDYWGEGAKFQYRLAVNDDALPGGENPVLSDIATVTVRYRPKPKLIPKHFITWQDVNLPISIAKGSDPILGGYTHPLFDAKYFQMDSLVNPDSGTEGSFVGGFTCGPTDSCNSLFDPLPGYYWLSGDYIKFKYTVSVDDPEWTNGPIESDPITSTIEVRPKIFNIGKSGAAKEYGVQTVAHPLRLAAGDGFQFPAGATLNQPMVVEILTALNPAEVSLFEPDGVTPATTFVCSTTECNAILKPTGNFSGSVSFDYKINVFDELNGVPPAETYATVAKTYTIDFFPRPVGVAFSRPNHFKAVEGDTKAINIFPGDGSSICNASHSTLAPHVGYTHSLCEIAKSADVIAPIENLGSLTLSCPLDGLCQGAVAAASPAGAWQGYGDASFHYTVTIDPPLLAGKLTANERAKLTSDPTIAVIEYYPRPLASGIRTGLNSFIYAIEGADQAINFDICENTPVANCSTGYVHPVHNERATGVSALNKVNVDVKNISCNTVTCSATLSPSLNFYSPKVGAAYTPATFDYNVTIAGPVGAITSVPNKQVEVVVYPKPKVDKPAAAYTVYTLQDDKTEIVIDLDSQYSHPYGDPATKIEVPYPPSLGDFYDGDPDAGGAVIPQANHGTAFNCTPAGRCTAWYKPDPGARGTDQFTFKVRIAGPADMAVALSSQLVEPVNAKYFTIEVLPKPTAQDVEVVVVEDSNKTFTLQKGTTTGYDHETSGVTATRLNFFGGSNDSGKVVVRDADDQGRLISNDISCPAGDCQVSCVPDGVCDLAFDDNDSWDPSSAVAGACDTNCPFIEFKPVVRVGPTSVEATSDGQPAKIKFNIRPRPRASTTPLTYMAGEGESISLTLEPGAGYTHAFYPASRIQVLSVVHSADNAGSVNFSCTVPGVCTWTFNPHPTFSPVSSDKFANIFYQPVVVDATPRTHGEIGTIGELLSPNTGEIRIEYRPKPKPTQYAGKLVQDTPKTFVIRLDEGFSLPAGYEKPAKSLVIVQNSNQNLDVSTCNLTSSDCVLPCPAGECSFEVLPGTSHYNPSNGTAGTAKFNYHIITEDAAFTPVRDLKSLIAGTATFDVRPKPVGDALVFKIRQDDSVPINLKPVATQGYSHPYSYRATNMYIDNDPIHGSISTAFDCELVAGPTQGECDGAYTPTSGYFGTDNFLYRLRVNDPVLPGTIDSVGKLVTIDVRPVPVVTATEVVITTRENVNKAITLSEAAVASGLDYFYPASYNLHPHSILVDQTPSTLGTLGAFTCTTGVTSPKGCSSTYTVGTDLYGPEYLKYRIKIEDLALGTDEFVVSNQGTVKLDIRPIIRANDVSYADNTYFKAIENRTLNWKIRNGATLGYTYPASYPTVLSELQMIASAEVNGNASADAWIACASSECIGTFDPTPGYKSDINNAADRATFKFKVRVTDDALEVGDRVIESSEKTATIDVYPLPVPNDRIFYTVENTPVTVEVKRGASKGYTHLRDHNPSGIVVGALTNVDSDDLLVDGDFLCSNDACSALFSPDPLFKSTDANTFATAKFKVTVVEPGPGREPTSDSEATIKVVAYPRPIADSSVAIFSNIVAWEGEATPVVLAKDSLPTDGLGYYHLWGHDAMGVQHVNLTGGVLSTWSCPNGACSTNFTPDLGSLPGHYGLGKGSFEYKVRTEYTSLATPEVWSDNKGLVTFNVRAKAFTVDKTYSSFVERPDGAADYVGITTASVDLNDGYTYNFGTNQVTKIKLREYSPFKDATCNGGCATDGIACAGGICTLPRIDTSADKNRATGTDIRMQFAVLVEDDHDGNAGTPKLEKWSDWADLIFDLLPRARGEVLTANPEGIEHTPYAMSVKRGLVNEGNGYTHIEGLNATEIMILGEADAPLNISSPAAGQIIPCNATTGDCNFDITPSNLAFNDVAGQTGDKGVGYGWATLKYKVKVPTSGQDVWSTPGIIYIYFRPAPYSSVFSIADAIEQETIAVTIAPGSGVGYTHDLGLKASSISVPQNRATATVGTTSCVPATGVCTVNFTSAVPGTYSFDYKVTVNGVEQLSWGTINVDFRARHRTVAINKTMIEGDTLDIDFVKGVDYTHNPATGDDEFASHLVIEKSSLFNVKEPIQVFNGSTPQDCPLDGGTEYVCPCLATSCRIVLQHSTTWTPPIGNKNVMNAGFSYKTRAQNSFELSAPTKNLASLNDSNVNITVNARIVANSRNFNAGVDEGEEGITKVVLIKEGAGDTAEGGYNHRKFLPANEINILDITGATIDSPSCAGGAPCTITCPSGECTVNVKPLVDSSFVTSADFTYKITDAAGFQSHNDGLSHVYFYPLPKANSAFALVLANDPTENPNSGTTINIGRSLTLGYTHLISANASSWSLVDGTNAGGAFSAPTWTCTGTGGCSVLYQPNVITGISDYSTNATNLFTFTYNVSINAPHGVVTSPVPGTYSIELYPPPKATQNLELKWVEGSGDIANAPNNFDVSFTRNVEWTHRRNYDPEDVELNVTTGGTFTSKSCSGSACIATFSPNSVSPAPGTPAGQVTWSVAVDDTSDKYGTFYSNTKNLNIHIFPKPKLPVGGQEPRVINATQGESIGFKMGSVAIAGDFDDNDPQYQYKAFSHLWSDPGLYIKEFNILVQPRINGTQTGVLAVDTCSGQVCTFTYTPDPAQLSKIGDASFTYEVIVKHNTWGEASTGNGTGFITIRPYIVATGEQVEAPQSIDYTDPLLPIVNNGTYTGLVLEHDVGGDNNGFKNVTNNPNSATDIRILAVSQGYFETNNSSSIVVAGLPPNGLGKARFSNISKTTAPFKWQADFDGENYFFGDLYLQYEICEKTPCTDPTSRNTAVTTDQAKWLHLHVNPADIPPTACVKTAGGSVIFYQGLTKNLILEKGEACENGKWVVDQNEPDVLKEIRFLGTGGHSIPPGATISGIAGYSTCSTVAGDRVCRCAPPALEVCKIDFKMTGAPGDYTVAYHVKTLSSLIGAETESQVPAISTFKVVAPLAAVGKNFSVNTNEDIPPIVSVDVNVGYYSIDDVSQPYGAGKLPAPDGYDMLAEQVQIISTSSNVASYEIQNCDELGACPISVTLKDDTVVDSTINFQVKANGVWSTTKTITITVNPIDDAPNEYRNAVVDRTYERRNFFYGDNGWYLNEGSFYHPADWFGPGDPAVPEALPVEVFIKPFAGANPQQYGPGNYYYYFYGYYDIEGDLATSIRRGSVSGGSLSPFVCGAAASLSPGHCKATFTPDGSLPFNSSGYYVATYNYWVTANGLEQSTPSLGTVYVWKGDITPAVAKDMPIDLPNPDITSETYPAEFIVARGKTKRITIRRGPSDSYTKSAWYTFDDTIDATSVDICDGVDCPAAPVNVNIQSSDFSCSFGICEANVTALESYVGDYPFEAVFYYRVNTNEDYARDNGIPSPYSYAHHLKASSNWAKVTMKVVQTLNTGCEEQPLLAESYFIDRQQFGPSGIVQGTKVTFDIGKLDGSNNPIAGNGYSHTGTGATWHRLQNVEILEVLNGSITTPADVNCSIPGQAGRCQVTFTPTGFGGDDNDDFIGHWARIKLKVVDDAGCFSTPQHWYVNYTPKISTRNVCTFDFFGDRSCFNETINQQAAKASSQHSLVFRKRGAKGWNDFGQYEYDTFDNSNATKVILKNFRTTQIGGVTVEDLLKSPYQTDGITGDGVSCTGSLAGANFECVIETTGCVNGTCQALLNTTTATNWGMIQFDYDVYVDTTKSLGYWERLPGYYFPESLNNADNQYWNPGTSRYDVFVKATPIPTNPSSYVTGVNSPITLQIGKQELPNVDGYTYEDTENLAGKDIVISLSNPQNGTILSSSFDQNTKVSTISFLPAFNFDGTASIDYQVSVWGVQSSVGTLSITVKKHLKANDAVYTISENAGPAAQLVTKGTNYQIYGAHPFTDALNLEIRNDDLTALTTTHGTFSLLSCDTGVTGDCQFTYEPPSGFFGTKTFKYRVSGGDTGVDETWSNWASLQIDVLKAPESPIAYPLAFTGNDVTPLVILVSQGAGNGYTDGNGDLATYIDFQNVVGGDIVESGPVACNAAGICALTFTASGPGAASLQYAVTDGISGYSAWQNLSLTIEPALVAQNKTVNGARNVTKTVKVNLNDGYLYSVGALDASDKIAVTNTQNGSVAGSEFNCLASGVCEFDFVPTGGFVGTASVDFRVQDWESGLFVRQSGWKTITIDIAATNEAPIANDFAVVVPDRNQMSIGIALDSEYTDREADEADLVTITSQEGGTATFDSCVEGACTIKFTPTNTPSFSGQGKVTYTVQEASGATSNIATILLTIPADLTASYSLAWVDPAPGTPYLDDQCKMTLPAQVTTGGAGTCGSSDCTTFTGFTSSGLTGLTPAANISGTSVQINKFNAPGKHLTKWTVANDSETLSIGRYLLFSESVPTSVKLPIVSLLPSPTMSMDGMQALTSGCTGSSCNGNAVASISAGERFSCALMVDSRVRCWGTQGTQGQLGNYSATGDTEIPTPVRAPYNSSIDLYGITAVSVGQNHACVLLASGEVACWGENGSGQLGDNTTADSDYPVYVQNIGGGGHLSSVAAISAGDNHTCAVKSDRTVVCWGDNTNGQLGDGTAISRSVPVSVQKVTGKTGSTVDSFSDLTDVFAVASGGSHTCAIQLNTDGTTIFGRRLMCWGANQYGQIGDKDVHSDTISEFTKVGITDLPGSDRLFATMVRKNDESSFTDAVALSTGQNHTCAITAGSDVYCWGRNNSGQLGHALSGVAAEHVEAIGGGTQLSGAAAISAGKEHTCAVMSDRSLACWGLDFNGQIGNGDPNSNGMVPSKVVGVGGASQLDGVYAVATGASHTCAVVSSGVIHCFGSNDNGESGSATPGNSNSPNGGVNNSLGGLQQATLLECGKNFTISVP